jgi:hypothetical protein
VQVLTAAGRLPTPKCEIFVGMIAGAANRVPAAYGSNYERLRAIKKAHDPENVFHHNQNIAP